eukprot:1065098-Rhodomonas_salina.1
MRASVQGCSVRARLLEGGFRSRVRSRGIRYVAEHNKGPELRLRGHHRETSWVRVGFVWRVEGVIVSVSAGAHTGCGT